MLRLRNRPSPQWLWPCVAALILGAALYLLAPILAPFLAAAILAYMLDPIVDRLERRGLPRAFATILALIATALLLALLLLIVVPLFYRESVLLYEQLPAFVEMLRTRFAPWAHDSFGIDLAVDAAGMKQLLTDNLQDARGIAQKVLSSLTIGGIVVIGFVVNLLLVPVVLFYLLRDWRVLLERIEQMIPRRWHGVVTGLAREVDAVLSEFLRGEILVMLIMSVFYVAGLWLVGLQFALPIGLVTGLLVFVPYLGSITGLALATVAALMQFQSFSGVVPAWIVLVLGQTLEGMAITPWLVGERIGLHPVAVIFALLAFGQLFGFFGILLALPASAVLLVGLRHARDRYRRSALYRR